MNFDRYEYDQLDEFTYRFYSEGYNGRFEIRVKITEMVYHSYNLGFGVFDPQTEELDDLVEIRNGDSQKLLATVANITLMFLEDHTRAHIYATGSTKSRTRLYQMGINKIMPTLNGYMIFGYPAKRSCMEPSEGHYPEIDNEWYKIQLGVAYDAFLIYKS
ncbi:hypothetical protein LZD49_10780 [Dyadobacter sp. CY261]|uniref:DUF6934 family protein n=1 Tax=Dyadobacter sp. CY261 TaxID=2907203 RepID=UPI001F19CD9C|nr:hypothetical protein [Dyadobacter sp. CY261]MCF0070958.1 hypothetical protein [Dyadobacter sp. CY261]